MAPVTSAPSPPRTRRPSTPPAQRAAPPSVVRSRPFSVIVLTEHESAVMEQIDEALHDAGASDVRYASSPADLLRRTPLPLDAGVGIICRSPRSDVILHLIVQLRQRGWRRLVIACGDGDDTAVRLAIAAKVRCMIRRTVDQTRITTISMAGRSQPHSHGLSAREVEVLQGVANGHTNNEIGEMLGLSGLTVKSHLARIARKTGTGDRAEMVAIVMRAGLVE